MRLQDKILTKYLRLIYNIMTIFNICLSASLIYYLDNILFYLKIKFRFMDITY